MTSDYVFDPRLIRGSRKLFFAKFSRRGANGVKAGKEGTEQWLVASG
jgi:hypothetical protein